MAFDGVPPAQTIAEHFLSMSSGNERAALEAACATLELFALHVSRGEMRLPPTYQVREPKKHVEAIVP